MPTYPADCYIVHAWFPAPISAWGDLCDGPVLDAENAQDAILSHFTAHPATLDAVMVLRRSDAGWRDVTEDTLIKLGEWLSDCHADEPSDYPLAFAEWATDAMRDAMAAAAARAKADEAADWAWSARMEGEAA